MRTLDTLRVQGLTVFLRVDYNVPLSADGKVADDIRITATLPTIRRLQSERAARIVIASALGRPKTYDPAFSLQPVASTLSSILGKEVGLLPLEMDAARSQIAGSPEGSVLLLENMRFYAGEPANDAGFARELAGLADVYVSDAFGASHRAHASIATLPALLPSAAGLLLEREVRELRRLTEQPPQPFLALLGGAKVSDKLGLIQNLLPKVDHLLIGGAMANTFLMARGCEVGKSLVERDKVSLAAELLEGPLGERIELPVDVVAADSVEGTPEEMPASAVRPDLAVYDIGSRTVEQFSVDIARAKTIFWNGPMGMFEREKFARGTFGVARAVADCSGHTVVGGGDSAAAVRKAGLQDAVGHLSTGGGASLELLEGRTLPGVAALEGADA